MRIFAPLATTSLACLVTLAALCLPGAAFGQYAWIDDKGIRQYSDAPPPASVPANRILKAPRVTAGQQDAAAAQGGGAATAPLTIAEKNAEFNKRRTERVEQEKKAADESKRAADKSRNCARARVNLRALESDMRVATTGANGERSYLSDAQRARETAETRRFLQDCK